MAALVVLGLIAPAGHRAAHAARAEPVRIAISTFESAGVADSLAVALKPFLVKDIAASPRIIVVEESRLPDALEYIKLQQSGLCTDDYCPVEPGAFLTAQKIVAGTITKLGQTYFFSVSIIDVQSLQEEYTDTAACQCIEDVLHEPITALGIRMRAYLETGAKPDTPVHMTRAGAPPRAPASPMPRQATVPPPPVAPGQQCPEDMVYIPKGHFCMDRYEFPNKKGVQPFEKISLVSAREQCANIGKRLPTRLERLTACGGPDSTVYAYGNTYKRGVCAGTPTSALTRKGFPKPSGSHPECKSGYGVYDLSGNVFELVEDGEPVWWSHVKRKPLYRCDAGLGGVGGSPSRTSDPATTSYPDIGFRCALDAQGPRPSSSEGN